MSLVVNGELKTDWLQAVTEAGEEAKVFVTPGIKQ